MSDFLISFNPGQSGPALLSLLQKPYGGSAPAGNWMARSWNVQAELEDRIAAGKNSIIAPGLSFSWCGDLVFDEGRPAVEQWLADHALDLSAEPDADRLGARLQFSPLTRNLNGAAAAVLAGEPFICIFTDPMSAVQVYLASDDEGNPVAVGTHPDLVAACGTSEFRMDPTSVCDFISMGTPCWPFTMHQNVKELAPGTIHIFRRRPDGKVAHREFAWWKIPAEVTSGAKLEELAEEFARCWRKAVINRCRGDYLGVQLSGGLDSRLVLAAIPREARCVTLTLCDTMNREARIAQQVAECYGRDWQTLQRDDEYVGRTAIDSIRFTGCEGEWHHAHSLGFARQFAEMGLDGVFTGLYMDNNFKGYYAKDLVRVSRLGGLLPAAFRVRERDYINRLNPFCRDHVKSEVVAETIERRRRFYEPSFARQRSSPWEWLDGYPVTQASDNTGWIVERRVMPLRLPVMDRHLVNLAFQVPIQMKAGNEFFLRAATKVLGPGNGIPNANDGVNPTSGHVSRLAQRSWRKLQGTGRQMMGKLGMRLAVPHSWHDYQTYWRESEVLHRLIAEHGKNLEEFEPQIFQGGVLKAMQSPALKWRVGCRLVQLAVWRSLIKDYRLQGARTVKGTPETNYVAR